MTPEQLCEKLGGEVSLNRMKAYVDGKLEIIARMNKAGEYEFTSVGKAQAAKFNAETVVGIAPETDSKESEDKPKRRGRKPKDEEVSDDIEGLY